MNQKNVSTFLSFAFLIVIICSALLPVFSLQNNVSISSHGTVNYPELSPPPLTTPSPSPSPTPPPTPSPYIGTNLAPLEQWFRPNEVFSPMYWDTAVTHNGNPSIRNEGIDPYRTREVNSGWISVKPGDRIVLSAWIKVDPSNLGTTSETFPQSGARLGIDWYDAEGRITSLNYNPGGGLPAKPDNPEPTQGIIDNFVGWGSDWTHRTIDCIVPENAKDGRAPTGVILWFMAWTSPLYRADWQDELASAWLSETEFYINPT